MPARRPARIALPALGVAVALAIGPAGRSEDPSPMGRADAMAGLARAVVVVDPGRGGARADLVAEPIYRFDDPTRRYSDGTIWAYGRPGRPAALFCLSLEKNDRGERWWLHELTSLAAGPLAASSRHPSGGWIWTPREPGIKFQAVPDSPAPGDDEAKRLRQMREIARRFKASETLDPARDAPSDRFELRLLPQPIHRYRDPGGRPIDGAIFLLSYGRNPEIALLIEAGRKGEAAPPSWSFAVAPLSAARLRVSLDDRPVADIPKPPVADGKRPYCLLARRALDLKD